ncbi:hypothetical protein [Levilactobacillus sp. HBUAS70063]|uniref:hypothetical protein n=1 Tax=Levilactobacillus sp. HBUAS70063 TaxID=3109359 RepID=UPI003132E661
MKIESGRVNPNLVIELQEALGTPLTQADLIQLVMGQHLEDGISTPDLAAESDFPPVDQQKNHHRG